VRLGLRRKRGLAQLAASLPELTNAERKSHEKRRSRHDVSSKGSARHRGSVFRKALITSSGEMAIDAKLAESGQRTRAGHLVRFMDIQANRVNGAFDATAEGVTPDHYVEEYERVSAAYYGSAGPAFVARLLAEGVSGDDIRRRLEGFVGSVRCVHGSGACRPRLPRCR
jgi:hypothetical protein